MQCQSSLSLALMDPATLGCSAAPKLEGGVATELSGSDGDHLGASYCSLRLPKVSAGLSNCGSVFNDFFHPRNERDTILGLFLHFLRLKEVC